MKARAIHILIGAMALSIAGMVTLNALGQTPSEQGWEYGMIATQPGLVWVSPEATVGPFASAERFADALRNVYGLPLGSESDTVYVLNLLGERGWELVSFTAPPLSMYVFKRPR